MLEIQFLVVEAIRRLLKKGLELEIKVKVGW